MEESQVKVGDKVSYWDVANQGGEVWEVMTTPEDNRCPKWGWTQGFGLMDTTTGAITHSDLRQHGWRPASDNYGPVK